MTENYLFLQMPHESTVEHTGEVFEPTESSAFAPRGFSFSEDTFSTLQRSNSTGSTTWRCDDDDDDDDDHNDDDDDYDKVQNGEGPAQNSLETVHEEKTSV